MGVLTREEFDIAYIGFSYCKSRLRELRNVELFHIGQNLAVLADLKQTPGDEKNCFTPDQVGWFVLPWWYINSLFPDVVPVFGFSHIRYCESVLALAGYACRSFHTAIRAPCGIKQTCIENPPPVSEVFLDVVPEGLDEYLISPEDWESEYSGKFRGTWEVIVTAVNNWIEEWNDDGNLSIGMIYAKLNVEYSKFLTENIEYARDMPRDILSENFYASPNFLGQEISGKRVSVKQIAAHVSRAVTTINKYTSEWPTPAVKHSGNSGSQWIYDSNLRSILSRQFDWIEWPEIGAPWPEKGKLIKRSTE